MGEKGRLLVIEGLDGSGKATQAARLAEWLRGQGKSVEQITFPDYASDSSALVRMYLEGRIGGAMDVNAYAASGFYAADRYISYHNYWKKPYLSGHTIVSDRYTTSNACHQMSKLPKEQWDDYLRWMEDFEYVRMELPRPHQVVYLDMQPATSRTLIMQRAGGDESRMDMHERDMDYLLQCRQAALFVAERLGWTVVSCCDGEVPDPVDVVFERIVRAITGKDL